MQLIIDEENKKIDSDHIGCQRFKNTELDQDEMYALPKMANDFLTINKDHIIGIMLLIRFKVGKSHLFAFVTCLLIIWCLAIT